MKINSYCTFPQCGHSFDFFALSSISSGIRFCENMVYAALFFLISEKFTRSSSGISNLEQDLHVDNNNLRILSINAICNIGSASSICPK